MKKSTTADPVCPYCGHVEKNWQVGLKGNILAMGDRLRRQCPRCRERYMLTMYLAAEFESQTEEDWREAYNRELTEDGELEEA